MELSFRNFYWRWLKNLAFLFLISALMMTLARLFFGFYFGSWTELRQNMVDLRAAFLLGLRFDLVPLAYINALPFLLMQFAYFVPGKAAVKILRGLFSTLVFMGHALLLWVLICDYAFYSYYQDHINVLFFGFFEDDTIAILVSIWKNYNLILWLTVIFGVHYFLLRTVKIMFSPFDFDLKTKKFSWWMPVTAVLGLALIAFLGRGNFTRLPLSIEDSHISQNEFINKLSQNGILTLNRAIKIRKTFGQKEYDYQKKYGFNSWQEAYAVAFGKEPAHKSLIPALTVRTPENQAIQKIQPHVVLVVMESFGSYWNGSDSPDFNLMGELKRHFKEGILFENFLSAENGTIGSMISIAASQPIRPGARFLSESSFMKTPLASAGQLPYSKAGYDTHFIYGGKLGWRDLGKYLGAQGFHKLWGADEIREAMPELNNIEGKDLGNEWGIFDEYLYTFIEEQLRYAIKPQFFLVLTTSNHPPFEYPSSYNTLPLKIGPQFLEQLTVNEDLAKKRFLGIQYANQKLGEFLSKIKLSALNEKTVVALTGDHSYWITKGVGHTQEFRRYAVPFFIQAPYRLRPKDIDLNNFGSHEDIFPTLYHLTLSGAEYIKLGENLFKDSGIAINSAGIVADKSGAHHHSKSWVWAPEGNQMLQEATAPDSTLLRKKEAFISLTDQYLKEEKNRTRPAAGNGPQ